MKVDEVAKLKREVEDRILGEIIRFMEQTGTCVNMVHLDKVHEAGRACPKITGVAITVNIV